MNKLRKLIILFSAFTLINCGSSQRVITDEGKIYEVSGSKIKKNGVEVTDDLSESEKLSINAFVEKKEKEREAFEKKQKQLEDAIVEQEKIKDKANNTKKQLEQQLETLESNLQEKLDARDNYVSLNKKYNDKKNKFKKLKKEGKLSPNDIEDWKDKLSKLKQKVKEAKNRIK